MACQKVGLGLHKDQKVRPQNLRTLNQSNTKNNAVCLVRFVKRFTNHNAHKHRIGARGHVLAIKGLKHHETKVAIRMLVATFAKRVGARQVEQQGEECCELCVQSYAYVANESTNGLCVQDKAVSVSQKSASRTGSMQSSQGPRNISNLITII